MNKDTFLAVEKMFFEDCNVAYTENIFIKGISQMLKYQSLGDYQLMTKMTQNLLEYLYVTMRTEVEHNPDYHIYDLDELDVIYSMLHDYIRTETHLQLLREQCEQNKIALGTEDFPSSAPAQEMGVANGH
jgi:hypothetical protein